MAYFLWQPSTFLQNIVHLRQSAAELWLFVQKFKMAAAAILDFVCTIFWHACMLDLKRNRHAKFRANTCDNKQVMSDKLNSNWRLPPSWIYYFCSFWLNVSFPVATIYIAATFNSSTLIGGRVIAVCAKIQDGGRRHLELIIFLHFGQMVYFRWQPSTWLQNCIHLRQSAAELLLFVHKSMMAAAAILDFIFVQYFGIPACRTSRWFISGGSRLPYCKISFIYFNRRLSYCSLYKNLRWRPPPSWILFLFNILAYLHVGPPE